MEARDSHEVQEDFTWQPYRIKPLAVWAMRMNRSFECTSLEGTLCGAPGDWLVRADDGWNYPVPHEVFQRFYTKREWRKPNEVTNKENSQAKGQIHAAHG